VAGAFPTHGVIVMRAGRAPVLCLLGEGRLEPLSPLEAMWNTLVESSIMTRSRDGGLLRVEPMKVAPESFLLGERIRPPKAVSDELEVPKPNGFTEGEATACQTFIIGGDGKCR
jgi:hypothetical protein